MYYIHRLHYTDEGVTEWEYGVYQTLEEIDDKEEPLETFVNHRHALAFVHYLNGGGQMELLDSFLDKARKEDEHAHEVAENMRWEKWAKEHPEEAKAAQEADET